VCESRTKIYIDNIDTLRDLSYSTEQYTLNANATNFLLITGDFSTTQEILKIDRERERERERERL
jgi:hypothetical protein